MHNSLEAWQRFFSPPFFLAPFIFFYHPASVFPRQRSNFQINADQISPNRFSETEIPFRNSRQRRLLKFDLSSRGYHSSSFDERTTEPRCGVAWRGVANNFIRRNYRHNASIRIQRAT